MQSIAFSDEASDSSTEDLHQKLQREKNKVRAKKYQHDRLTHIAMVKQTQLAKTNIKMAAQPIDFTSKSFFHKPKPKFEKKNVQKEHSELKDHINKLKQIKKTHSRKNVFGEVS